MKLQTFTAKQRLTNEKNKTKTNEKTHCQSNCALKN